MSLSNLNDKRKHLLAATLLHHHSYLFIIKEQLKLFKTEIFVSATMDHIVTFCHVTANVQLKAVRRERINIAKQVWILDERMKEKRGEKCEDACSAVTSQLKVSFRVFPMRIFLASLLSSRDFSQTKTHKKFHFSSSVSFLFCRLKIDHQQRWRRPTITERKQRLTDIAAHFFPSLHRQGHIMKRLAWFISTVLWWSADGWKIARNANGWKP